MLHEFCRLTVPLDPTVSVHRSDLFWNVLYCIIDNARASESAPSNAQVRQTSMHLEFRYSVHLKQAHSNICSVEIREGMLYNQISSRKKA